MQMQRIGAKILNMVGLGKFKISVPIDQSRANKGMSIPDFQAKACVNNLQDLFIFSKTHDALAQNAYDIVRNYFWPPESMGVIYKAQDGSFKNIPIQAEGLKTITAEDLGIGKFNGLWQNIVSKKMTVYIPNTSFDRTQDFYYFPEKIKDVINTGQPIVPEVLVDGGKLWDASSIKQNIAGHSRSIFVMPLMNNNELIGVFVLGYKEIMVFDEFLTDVYYPAWLYRLGDAIAMTLDKLLILSKK